MLIDWYMSDIFHQENDLDLEYSEAGAAAASAVTSTAGTNGITVPASKCYENTHIQARWDK